MSRYVLDTSVVVQWFHQENEPHAKEARKILEDLQTGKIVIIVPDFLPVELLNVFVKGKKSPIDEVKGALKTLFQLPINLIEPTFSLLEATARLMEQYTLTSYDAYFLALAQHEECTLISDDQKAHSQISDGSVLMLQNYKT